MNAQKLEIEAQIRDKCPKNMKAVHHSTQFTKKVYMQIKNRQYRRRISEAIAKEFIISKRLQD